MAKKVRAIIKLQIPAGQANPAPPVGLTKSRTSGIISVAFTLTEVLFFVYD